MTNGNEKAPVLARDLGNQHFYGSLEIKYEAGRVVLLKKTETMKPDQRNNQRDDDDFI